MTVLATSAWPYSLIGSAASTLLPAVNSCLHPLMQVSDAIFDCETGQKVSS